MNSTTVSPHIATQEHELLSSLWEVATAAGYGIALWRLPKASETHLIMNFSGQASTTTEDVEQLPPGFLWAPFLRENDAHQYMEADFHLKYHASQNGNIAIQCSQENLLTQWLEEKRRNKQQPEARKIVRQQSAKIDSPNQLALAFPNLVKDCVEAIAGGEFQKAVLSRCKEIELPADFRPTEVFTRLCQAYPTAFVSLAVLPGAGVWMGATPETLVSVDEGQIFRTMSLAGTQAAPTHQPLSEIMWTQKEIEEQAMVSRYVVNCFKKIRLREFEEIGPRTVAAGNLVHLRTDYTVDMQAVNFPQLGTVMLRLLHPTSAVCGMPKDAALAFIQNRENYDRELFSGYLGPVNIEGRTDIFVNLRCTKLLPPTENETSARARLFAGAGITADSQPEKELLETSMKMQTIARFLT